MFCEDIGAFYKHLFIRQEDQEQEAFLFVQQFC